MRIYLCCGRGTGVRGEWIGVDIQDHGHRPLILADVRKLDGSRFRDCEFIFSTPPCSSFTDLPWRKATNKDLDVVEACLRIAEEADVPHVLEGSRFMVPFLGEPACRRGPHYFWGDVGVLPLFEKRKSDLPGSDPLRRAALPELL